MPIFDLFSKRLRRERGEEPEIFTYDDLPATLRAQIVHILQDAFGRPQGYQDPGEECFGKIHSALCREYGQFQLVEGRVESHRIAIARFLTEERSIERVLDGIEVALNARLAVEDDWNFNRYSYSTMSPQEAVDEINHRFLEHGVGFRFESGQVIRVDSELLHREATKPALRILSDKEYKGANSEFLTAHDHYRHGRHEACLIECLKAFESTLKIICAKRGWEVRPEATSSQLLNTIFSRQLIPSYFQSEFGALRATLESGVPTVRNKEAGHGRGASTRDVPPSLARYLLNLTAAAIVFLVEAEEAK